MDSFFSRLDQHDWVLLLVVIFAIGAVHNLNHNVRSIRTEIQQIQSKIESDLSSIAGHLYSISKDLTFIANQMRRQERKKQRQREERKREQRRREEWKQEQQRQARIAKWKELYSTDPELSDRLRRLTALVERAGGVMEETEDGNFVSFCLPDECAPHSGTYFRITRATTGEPLLVKAHNGRPASIGRLYAVDLEALDVDHLAAQLWHRPAGT